MCKHVAVNVYKVHALTFAFCSKSYHLLDVDSLSVLKPTQFLFIVGLYVDYFFRFLD